MSTRKIVQKFLNTNPFLGDYLRQDLLNYSAVARVICKSNSNCTEAAVVMALRRLLNNTGTHKKLERRILSLVQQAKITIESRISVLNIRKPPDYSPVVQFARKANALHCSCTIIEGSEATTLIFSSKIGELVLSTLGAYRIKMKNGLARIVMTFDEGLETTPGVVSYVCGLLSKAGINISEEMSCYNDIMLVINESDIALAVRALTETGQVI